MQIIDPETAEGALAYLGDHAPILMLGLDEQCVVTATNAYARRVLGAVEGRPLQELVVNPSAQRDVGLLARDGEGVHRLDFCRAERIPETYQVRFIRGRHGLVVVGHVDVEELTSLQARLLELNRTVNDAVRRQQQTNAELRSLGHTKNQFLGMAAHDLAHPLNTIVNFAAFLSEAHASWTDEQRGFLATILRAAADMQRLIDDFLDLAVIESGRLRLDCSAVCVHGLLQAAREELEVIGARHRVRVELGPPPERRRARLDLPKLRQVLVNLVSNAARHSPPGALVRVTAAWDGPDLHIAVRDEGPGIPVEHQQRLFQPFESGEAQRSRGERRVGLGLSIARAIVEAHGGVITVDSRPGAGCTMNLRLKAAACDEAGGAVRAIDAAAGGAPAGTPRTPGGDAAEPAGVRES